MIDEDDAVVVRHIFEPYLAPRKHPWARLGTPTAEQDRRKAPENRRQSGGRRGARGLMGHLKENGAAYRTRTCDPRITNAMLYQLS